METSAANFSFQSLFLSWRGGKFHFDKEAVLSGLRSIHASGARWIMTGGVNCAQNYEFNVCDAARWLRGCLDELGMEISSHHCVLPTVVLPGGSSDAIRRNMEETVEICALLRPSSLVLHPGNVLGRPDWSDGLAEALAEAEKAYGHEALIAQAASNIKFLAQSAAPCNMNVAVETMWERLPLQGAADLPGLLEAVDEPNAGYCVDSGHLHLAGESPAKWLRLAGSKLFETHFHDNQGKLDQHLPAGFGTIDWLELAKALEETAYAGPVAFERGGWPGDDEVEGYRRTMDWWNVCRKIALGQASSH